MIEPTVGRKVWYWPFANEKQSENSIHGMAHAVGQPLSATIVCVWGSRSVNLVVADSCGRTFGVTSRTLIQEGDPIPEQGGYAVWMPFQIGQAKKHAEPTALELGAAARQVGKDGY